MDMDLARSLADDLAAILDPAHLWPEGREGDTAYLVGELTEAEGLAARLRDLFAS